jgi:hypothetical protein
MQMELPRFAQVQDSQQAAEHGYLVKNGMQRVIAPEVEALIKVSPELLLRWRIHGIDIVLAADGIEVHKPLIQAGDWSVQDHRASCGRATAGSIHGQPALRS